LGRNDEDEDQDRHRSQQARGQAQEEDRDHHEDRRQNTSVILADEAGNQRREFLRGSKCGDQ